MVVPKDLEERAEGKVSVNLPITMTVALRKDSKVIDFNVHVDNKGLSHRLCVLFDSQIVSSFNYADEPLHGKCGKQNRKESRSSGTC